MSKPRSGWTRARPLNSDQNLGVVAKCPYCNQFHLRPGYCQALDPINAEKYPDITNELRSEMLLSRRVETEDFESTIAEVEKCNEELPTKGDFVRNTSTQHTDKATRQPTGEISKDTATVGRVFMVQPGQLSGFCSGCGEPFAKTRSNDKFCPACRSSRRK